MLSMILNKATLVITTIILHHKVVENPQRRGCDLILADSPSLGLIYEAVNAELEKPRQNC